MTDGPGAHERRVIRRLEARGEPGLGEALILLDGTLVGGRYRIVSLYAVGSEGAVFLARDEKTRTSPLRVAKVAALPVHRPFSLTDADVVRRRAALREEAADLENAATAHLPRCLGLFETANPALDASWGGAFAAPEPCLVMEKLPGFDLDLWLARVHSSDVPQELLRRHLDHVAVVVLTALMELQERSYYYTDLRPGNVRIHGRSRERVRLLDAGSLVRADDSTGKFPHVPAYLPPDLFRTSRQGGWLRPSQTVQAAMAGRMLFEVATGRVPRPGEHVETALLHGGNVSPPVAETIEGLCTGTLTDVTTALAHLAERSRRGPVEHRGAAQAIRRSVAADAVAAANASVAARTTSVGRESVAARPPAPAAPPIFGAPLRSAGATTSAQRESEAITGPAAVAPVAAPSFAPPAVSAFPPSAAAAARAVAPLGPVAPVRPLTPAAPPGLGPATRPVVTQSARPGGTQPGRTSQDLFSILARAGVKAPTPPRPADWVPEGSALRWPTQPSVAPPAVPGYGGATLPRTISATGDRRDVRSSLPGRTSYVPPQQPGRTSSFQPPLQPGRTSAFPPSQPGRASAFPSPQPGRTSAFPPAQQGRSSAILPPPRTRTWSPVARPPETWIGRFFARLLRRR